MSMYQHRGMGAAPPGSSNRLNDLLNEIRQEFENQSRQTEGFEHQSMSNCLAMSQRQRTFFLGRR
jgi:glucose repression regulatory protein TUP1